MLTLNIKNSSITYTGNLSYVTSKVTTVHFDCTKRSLINELETLINNGIDAKYSYGDALITELFENCPHVSEFDLVCQTNIRQGQDMTFTFRRKGDHSVTVSRDKKACIGNGGLNDLIETLRAEPFVMCQVRQKPKLPDVFISHFANLWK